MNYLAHALLAGADDDLRLGGMLGDFVKGSPTTLANDFPPGVLRGIALHRRIDSFVDRHPVFLLSRSRVSAERRRYSGIMVDMFYDHFLAVHWSRFSDQPLEDFTQHFYALLAANGELLPERLGRVLPHMRRDDWLLSYREADSVAFALDRMAQHRLRQPNRMGGAGEELLAAYAAFEADFLDFFPEAMAFAQASGE